MPYTYNTPNDQREMLEAIGVASLAELFEQIPESLQLQRPLELPPSKGELELTQHMIQLATRNGHAENMTCFLGGGSYDHFIPAVVDTLAARSEFYTSYTPYQAEVSQGNLQAMFEYQTLICQLTGLDLSNASLYDGGSAVTEAALMCVSATRRHGKIIVPETVHPEYRQILQTYCANLESSVVTIPCPDGRVSVSDLVAELDNTTSCVIVQHPNFFGALEEVQQLADATHAAGAKLVVSFDPISLGILKRPGDMGADVAVAEGQSLGSPMAYGGPYLGIMACREEFLRRLPGRLAGETKDRRGKRCFVLTLQTREQHIRREKATSNICTNQGLFALRASIYLAALGPCGLQETATLCARKAAYAFAEIAQKSRFERRFPHPIFKEFVIRDTEGDVAEALAESRQVGILAGIPLGQWYSDLSDCFLVAVTEKRTRHEIDAWARSLTRTPTTESMIHA